MTQNVTNNGRIAMGVLELAEASAGFLWQEIARGPVATIRLEGNVSVSLDEAKRHLECEYEYPQRRGAILMNAESIAAGLEGARRSGDYWMALCPCHNDTHPSLKIEDKKGKVLVKCFAGCSQDSVVEALKVRGLWKPGSKPGSSVTDPDGGNSATPISTGCTVADYSAAKGLDPGLLAEVGLTDITYENLPAVRMPYRDADGTIFATRFRIAQRGDRFRWKKGSRPGLYGLSEINPEARRSLFS